MEYAIALLALALFLGILKMSGLVPTARNVIELGKLSVSVIRDPSVDDRQKEHILQRYSIDIFKCFFILVAGAALALGAPTLMILGLDHLDIVSAQNLFSLMLTWHFILVAAVFPCLFLVFRKR